MRWSRRPSLMPAAKSDEREDYNCGSDRAGFVVELKSALRALFVSTLSTDARFQCKTKRFQAKMAVRRD
jgi:hypothetical protein